MIKTIIIIDGHFKFKMAAITMLGNSSKHDLNELPDPENMSKHTKIKSISASHTEI
jgi:hypothetical protein